MPYVKVKSEEYENYLFYLKMEVQVKVLDMLFFMEKYDYTEIMYNDFQYVGEFLAMVSDN